jgi:energy-coupling factor transport system permease protein
MATRVPVLYREYDTVMHRRDPRVKVLLLFLLFLFLFMAPSWQWMLLAAVLGLILAAITHTPWKWLAVLWLIHFPSFIVIVGLPVGEQLFADHFQITDDIATGLRLVLAWTAAIFISVSLLSTLNPRELTNGLRGLGVPAIVAFAVGLSYRLLYVTLHDIIQIADAMQIKGVDLETRRPLRLLQNVFKLSLPVLFAVVRRGPVLMAALEMRGFLQGSGRRQAKFDLGDAALLASSFLILGLAIADQFGLLSLSSLATFVAPA